MFIFDEGFTNKRFQADQMINFTPFAPETTLKVSNKTIAFQKAFQAGSDHAFNSSIKTTSKSDLTAIRWVSIILSRLRNYSDIFPSSWKLKPLKPNDCEVGSIFDIGILTYWDIQILGYSDIRILG